MKFAAAIYEHAARFIDCSPYDVSRDADLLFQAHAEAYRYYRHAPVVVGIDIYNLEAEAYGAAVNKPDGNGVPTISEHICAGPEDILSLSPPDPLRDGRLPMILQTGERLTAAFPDAEICIPLSGPFSIASNLLGLQQLLFAVMDEPESVVQALQFLADGQLAICEHIAGAKLEAIVFESAAAPPLLSPQAFARIAQPALQNLVQKAARRYGLRLACIMGGNTLPILKDLVATGSEYLLCPAETDQQAFMQYMQAHPEITVRINMDPRVFLADDATGALQEAERAMALARGRAQVCIGTGVLPYEANPDVVLQTQAFVDRFR